MSSPSSMRWTKPRNLFQQYDSCNFGGFLFIQMTTIFVNLLIIALLWYFDFHFTLWVKERIHLILICGMDLTLTIRTLYIGMRACNPHISFFRYGAMTYEGALTQPSSDSRQNNYLTFQQFLWLKLFMKTKTIHYTTLRLPLQKKTNFKLTLATKT